MHRDKFYRQIDGVAMGGPLGPTFANFFLGHIERTLFNDIDCAPKMYYRYMDDVFAVFESETQKQAFLEHLNRQHPSLKFTVEDASSNVLPFLDAQVSLSNDGFSTTVYRKPTHTNVFLNFNAIAPTNWKFGLIFGALHRAYKICSSQVLFNLEVSILRNMFWRNGYSHGFFTKVLDKFNDARNLNRNLNVDPANTQQFAYLMKIPYVGPPSIAFRLDMMKLFKHKFKVDLKGVFTSTKFGDFFSLKSIVPLPLRAVVAYQFTCLQDASKSYIGKTKRHLLTRCVEHLDPESKKPSAINSHLKECVPCRSATIDNFKILRTCRNDYDLGINEALLIRKFQPFLNKQLYNSGAGVVLGVFS